MRKFLLTTILTLALCACSNDNEDNAKGVDNAVTVEAAADPATDMPAVMFAAKDCMAGLAADVHVDVSGGFGAPMAVFTADAPDNIPAGRFRVSLEVQPLEDYDDMNSDTGNMLVFEYPAPVTDIAATLPAIAVAPANLPLYYKWRIAVQDIAVNGDLVCTSSTVWYEAPLF